MYIYLEINLKLRRKECDIFDIDDGIIYIFECITSLNLEMKILLKLTLMLRDMEEFTGKGFLICFLMNPTMKELYEDLGLQVLEALKDDNLIDKIELFKNFSLTR